MPPVDFQAGQRCSSLKAIPSILILLIVFVCYGNSFHVPFQLDDKPGIVNNQKLHIDDLSPTTLWQTFFARPGADHQFYRPVVNLTLALNWYLGADNPLGYHMVNVFLHCLTALILCAVILRFLLETPMMAGRYNRDQARFIAIFGTLLWALNPIQTQAVTYIVQRMAIMAALFYMLGIFFYLSARSNEKRLVRIASFIGCLLCYLLAVGSKENAIMLPASLLLLEWFFISPSLGLLKDRQDLLWLGVGIVLFAGLLIVVFAVSGSLAFLFEGYDIRSFSMAQRLMTQARVVVWYLGLIFYPSPLRLSVEHDFQISTALFTPWTTLPAFLLIAAIVAAAAWRKRKNSLMGFGLLFFFLNHVVESTIIPLEPIFEHRNYLPSLFLFVPVAAGLRSLLDDFRQRKKSLYPVLVASISLTLVLLGIGTYLRNDVWQTEATLWEDAMKKAPNSARPPINLAQLLVKSGNPEHIDQALMLYNQSLSLKMARNDINAAVIGNMGGVYANNKNDLVSAIMLYRQSLEINPDYVQGRYDLSVLLTMQGHWEEALIEIDRIIDQGLVHEDYYNLKGIICLWQKQPEKALFFFKKSLDVAENKTKAYMGIGAALSTMGFHFRADQFLRKAHNGQPDAILSVLLLIENSLRAGDDSTAANWADRLLETQRLPEIEIWLKRLPTFYQSPPISIEVVAPLIGDRALAMSGRIRKRMD